MKKGVISKRKGVAVLLSFLLGFSSLSLCIETRALADGDESSSEGTLLPNYIDISAFSNEYTYTGEDVTKGLSATATSGGQVTLKVYNAYDDSKTPVTPVNVGLYALHATVPADETYADGATLKYFKIEAAHITDDMKAPIPVQIYTGSALEPSPTVTFNEKTLVEGTDYTVKYADNVNVGNAATVVVTGKGNFTDTASTLFTIKSPDKDVQVFASGFSDDLTKTYGEADFNVTATLSTGDGKITYRSSDPSVATVSEDTGLVSIKKAGSTVITATAAETEKYAKATASFTLTVSKATIVVTALDKIIKQGERAPLLNDPVLDTDYVVTGLIGTDALKGEAYMRYQKNGTEVTPDTSLTGTYDIVISGFLPPSANYNDVTFVNGTLTVQRGSGTSGGIGTPVIPGDSEIKGWDNVIKEVETELSAASEEGLIPVVTIDMNGSTVVVKELIEAIRGENIIIRLLYDNGVIWTIDGRDVDLIDKAKDVDLGVSIGGYTGSNIPVSAIRSVMTNTTKGTVRMEINHDGFLGFEATLSINVAKATGESVTSRSISRLYGMVANLYYFDPSTKKLKFKTSGYIDESGTADFVMSHASQYVIVIDEKMLGGTADVMRVYNPNSGRHHLTINRDEIDFLTNLGWRYEGIAFTANISGDDSLAVYRLYNPYSGEHFFTWSVSEKEELIYRGWKDEGVCWYSSDSKSGDPIFRFYNPNASDHHFTMNQNEVSRLVVAGWRNEGIAFDAVDGE